MNTIRTLAFSLALLSAFFAAPDARAQANNKPPGKMTFQGFLTDSSGNPLGRDNPTNMTVYFRLYKNATGTAPTDKLWAEQQVVTIDRGHFSVLLGEGTATGVGGDPNNAADLTPFFIGADASDRFLAIQVVGQSEVAPRIQFFPAPYAHLAQYANNIIAPTGASILNANNAGFIGIGTSNPEKLLQIGEQTTLGSEAMLRFESRSASGGSARNWEIGVPAPGDNSAGRGYSFVIDDMGRGPDAEFVIRWDTGFVGIGKTNPASLLDVNGTITGININGTHNGSGAGLTALQAPQLQGTIHSDRLPGTINGDKTFTGTINYNYGRKIDYAVGAGRTDVNNGTISVGHFSQHMDIVGGGNGDYTRRRIIFHAQGGSHHAGWFGINRDPRCPIDIAGWANLPVGHYGYLNFNGANIIRVNQASVPYSLLADQRIGASEFNAFSDARIKNVVGLSSAKEDLALIRKLRVTDYRPRDVVAEGTEVRKGFIAQEVEVIIPEAVTTSTNWIPNIYTHAAKVTVDNAKQKLSLTMTNAHELRAGDMVRLFTDEGKFDVKVASVPSEKEFQINEWTNSVKKVFVFGKEVNDFRAINYDRIFTTGIGAIQELATRLEQKSAQVDDLQKKVVELEKMVLKLAALQENKARAEVDPKPAQAASEIKVAQATK